MLHTVERLGGMDGIAIVPPAGWTASDVACYLRRCGVRVGRSAVYVGEDTWLLTVGDRRRAIQVLTG